MSASYIPGLPETTVTGRQPSVPLATRSSATRSARSMTTGKTLFCHLVVSLNTVVSENFLLRSTAYMRHHLVSTVLHKWKRFQTIFVSNFCSVYSPNLPHLICTKLYIEFLWTTNHLICYIPVSYEWLVSLSGHNLCRWKTNTLLIFLGFPFTKTQYLF